MTTILAYSIIIGYFIVERSLRRGEAALSLQPRESDQSSSKIIWICGLISILVVLLAPILNVQQIGYWNSVYANWAGVAVMVGGLGLRYWAAKTLGKFYTRTLQTIAGQQVIDKAPYSIIRHPGYLGLSLMEVGAGLAVSNWVALVVIMVVGAPSRFYRIQVEENMLRTELGEQYKAYSEKTWRLVPFIY